ncbi:MAG: EF-P lysine aminoacylase GenX, partial [Gammaproteobacteria bacterium]|nr:EF-P lysine aminoacylase GenX [Gammaproteobacteria bacterium]
MSWQPTASIANLRKRSELLAQVRGFFDERGVLEVQTSVLGSDTVTDVNIQSVSVPGYGFLQTSPKYQMKRLLSAGMPSCYQICPVFRDG